MEQISIFSGVLKALILTAPKNDVRTYLNGVSVEYKDGSVFLVSTDGHRLSIAHIVYSGEPFAPFIIPREQIANLKGKDFVLLENSEGYSVITSESQESRVRVISGQYPDWRRVIAKEFSKEAATFNAEYYGDLGKARKLVTGRNGDVTHLVTNGEKVAVDVITSDFVVYLMPCREDHFKREPLPEWL